MSNKLLLGGFLTSFAYLSFKVYERMNLSTESKLQKTDENHLILERMKERFESGHLKSAPFPAQIELTCQMNKKGPAEDVLEKPTSLCESIQNQLKRDWNSFLYQASKLILK